MDWTGTIFGCILFFSFFPLWGDDWEHRLQARLENESAAARYLLSRGEVSILGLAIVESDGELNCRAGFSSPFFLVGPVQFEGVLREAGSSSILAPGGELFKEDPEITMHTSMDTVSSYGAVTGDLERQRYCYIVVLEDDGYRGGGCFSFFPGPYLSLHFLHQISWEYSISEDTSWLTDHPYPLTGSLYHSWGVFKMKTDTLTINSALGISGGRCIPAGCYFRLSGTGKLPWLSLNGYITVRTPDFVTPSGDYPDEHLIMAGEMIFFPRSAGILSLGYGRKTCHPGLLPALYVESEEQFSADAALSLGIVRAKAGWERQIDVHSWGDFIVKDTYETKAWVDTKVVKISITGGYSADTEEERIISTGCDLVFKMRRHRAYISADCEINDGVNVDSSVKMKFQLSDGSVSASLSLPDAEFEKGKLKEFPVPTCTVEWKTLKKRWNDEE